MPWVMVAETDAENPRDDGLYSKLGVLLCWHRRYSLGDRETPDSPWETIRDEVLPTPWQLRRAGFKPRKSKPRGTNMNFGGWESTYDTLARAYDEQEVGCKPKDKPPVSEWDFAEQILDATRTPWLPVYMYDHSGLVLNTTGFSDRWDSRRLGFIFFPESSMKEMEWKRWTPARREKALQILREEIALYSSYIEGDVWSIQRDPASDEESDHYPVYGYDKAKQLMDELNAAEAQPATPTETHATGD